MTDSDLTPSSGNRIIAADIVNGKLIFKRYDGTEESFDVGSGFVESQILFLELKAEAVAGNGGNATPTIQIGSQLFSPEGDVLVDIDPDDVDFMGIEVGDDYLVSSNGGFSVYFRTHGLYVVMVDFAHITDLVGQVDYSTVDGAHNVNWQNISSTLGAGPRGSFPIVVKTSDLGREGASLSPYVYNGDSSSHDVSVTICITRVS